MNEQASRGKSRIIISSSQPSADQAKDLIFLNEVGILSRILWREGYKCQAKIPKKVKDELEYSVVQDVRDKLYEGRYRIINKSNNRRQIVRNVRFTAFYGLMMINSRHGNSRKDDLFYPFFESKWTANGYAPKKELQLSTPMEKTSLFAVKQNEDEFDFDDVDVLPKEEDLDYLVGSFENREDERLLEDAELENFAQWNCSIRGEHPSAKYLECEENPPKLYRPDFWKQKQGENLFD